MDKSLVKICPQPAELSEIKKNIPCTEEGCNRMFLNTSNLDMHLFKHHKKSNKTAKSSNGDVKYQYHCPIEKCFYNVKSERFFKNMKYLKQHFLKVHAERNFCCVKCRKGFSTEAAKNKHERMCGVKFICSCSHSYESYEALITHAKRHQHIFDEKYKSYGRDPSIIKGEDIIINTHVLHDVKPMPATVVPVNLLAAVALNEFSGQTFGNSVDKGVQTDTKSGDTRRHRKGASPSRAIDRAVRRRTSTHTQTGHVSRVKHPKISIQTQTMGDYILKKAMRAADIPVMLKEETEKETSIPRIRKRRKSMETQTTSINNCSSENNQDINLNAAYSPVLNPNIHLNSLNNFPSTSYSPISNSNSNLYQLDIDVLPDIWLGQKNSSGTQTSPISLNTLLENDEMFNHSVTQTDLNLLFDTESCTANTSSHSSGQGIDNLQNYFEDTTDANFNTSVLSNVPFEPDLPSVSVDPLASLDEHVYSSVEIGNLLNSDRKIAFEENGSCSTETQTDVELSYLLPDCDNDAFTLCSNIETQTTEEFTSSFDQLLYSNMCTQTCDDVLFSDLEFADIETQTAWPLCGDDSALVSTETQTALSGYSSGQTMGQKSWLIDTKAELSNTSHMETQTNMNDFRKIIAELVKENTNDSLL